MAREEDDDDSLPPLGEDTDKFLDDAKKGKPRSFLLICKGAKLKYLKVKKKPIKKGEIAEAKKQGYKGDAYSGVITGRGMELVFNLAVADGYQSEPVKEKVLKDFLEEHVGIKCKPSFAIVATAPEIPFDEDDLANPLIARFLKLAEQISAVLDARPETEAELKQTTGQIRALLQDGSFNEAEPQIAALEQRLQLLLSGGSVEPTAPAAQQQPQTQTPTQTDSTANANDALKAKLQEALNKLVPQLKQAVATFPDRKVELLSPVAEIKRQLEAGDLQNAKQGILSVGQLLKSLIAQSQSTQQSASQTDAPNANSEREEFERKRAELEPLYQQALREMLGDPNKFRTVWTYALEQAEAGVYTNAIKAMDRLAQSIRQAIAAGTKETDVIPENVVADRKKLLASRWQEALNLAFNEIQKIVTPISEQVPNEDPEELVDEIVDRLYSISDAINSAIEETQFASSKNLQPFEQALTEIREFRKTLTTDPLIQLLDRAKADLGVDLKFSDYLSAVLNELEASLAN